MFVKVFGSFSWSFQGKWYVRISRFGLNIPFLFFLFFTLPNPRLVNVLVIGSGHLSLIETVKPGRFTDVSDESKQSEWHLEAYLASFLHHLAWKSYTLG